MLRLCFYNVEHFNRLFTQTNQMEGDAAEQTGLDATSCAPDDRCRHHRYRRGPEHEGERRLEPRDQAGDLCGFRRAGREPGDDRAAIQRHPGDRSHVCHKRQESTGGKGWSNTYTSMAS